MDLDRLLLTFRIKGSGLGVPSNTHYVLLQAKRSTGMPSSNQKAAPSYLKTPLKTQKTLKGRNILAIAIPFSFKAAFWAIFGTFTGMGY